MSGHSVSLFGTFHVERNGEEITRFRGAKVRALLAYLAVESDRSHTRQALAGLFWPDQPEATALRNLTQALVRMREALGESDDPVRVNRHTVQWHSVSDVDVVEFSTLARSERTADLTRAADLYRGEFLAGFALPDCEAFEDWMLLTRERLQQQALTLLHTIAEQNLMAGLTEQAAGAALRQLALDPWREAAYRQLMGALALGGDRAAALAAYARCRQVLRDDLDIDPDDETRMLADRIQSGELRPALLTPPPRGEAGLKESHNLRAPLGSFVGREDELAFLATLADREERLVTVVGGGGTGKTRLALAAAWALYPRFADGAWWVSLVGIQPEDDLRLQRAAVVDAIATALGLMLDGSRPLLDDLAGALRGRAALLVLDNCEHLREAADIALELLGAAPSLRVLATSRAPLGLAGEVLLRLDGLPVPAADTPDPAAYAAVRLFLDRAARQVPGWGKERAEIDSTARLCRLLDGLPLGIELAAYWVGHYTPDEIGAALRADLGSLEARARGTADRHRTLEAVFDYAWRLLSPAEQGALASLSVFGSSFDRAAAQAVAGVGATTLVTLADKSLLRRAGVGRYSFHELLRQFVAARLTAGEATSLRDRHALHYLALAEQAAPELTGPHQVAWLARLDSEVDNLRVALSWARERDQPDLGLRLAGALGRFWLTHGNSSEGREWLNGAITRSHSVEVPAAIRARAIYSAGLLANVQGDQDHAVQRLEQSIALYREAADPVGAVRALNTLGGAAYDQGNLTRAIALWEESLGQARAANDLGEVARALGNLGGAHYHLDDLDRAGTYYEEALAIARRVGRSDVEAFQLGDLGNVARRQGDLTRAAALHRQALELKRTLGDERQIAITLEDLAALAAAEGRGERAARLLGAATALRTTIGSPLPAPELIATEQAVVAARLALGEERWIASFAAGQALRLRDAIAYALEM